MSTLADPVVRDACLARLARLNPSATRRWGRMAAHQMVCHLNDAFDVATGLRRRLTEFADAPQFAEHPFFGAMNRSEWLIRGYRHVDHHFRQFGA